MKKLFLLGLCVALLGGVACSSGDTTQPRAFDAAQSGCAGRDGDLETLALTVSPPTGPLTRGSIARFEVRVVRSAEIDEQLAAELPVLKGDGRDPTEHPVEGAIVHLSLWVPNALPLSGSGITDSDGEAIIAVKVKPSATRGIADGTAAAWREIVDHPCAHLVETGHFHQEAFATIK